MCLVFSVVRSSKFVFARYLRIVYEFWLMCLVFSVVRSRKFVFARVFVWRGASFGRFLSSHVPSFTPHSYETFLL